MYVIHDDVGLIVGVVTGDKNYGEHLSKFGHQWIYLADRDDSQVTQFDTMRSFVDVEKKAAGVAHLDCLCPSIEMSVASDKTNIASCGVESALISGIPTGAKVTIISDAGIEFEGSCDDGQIELTAADPTTYTVHISASPRYLPTSVQVIAR